MKQFIILLISIFAVYASYKCTKPARKDIMCIMLYRPVCVIYASKTNPGQVYKKNSGNSCTACLEDDALFYVDNACEDYPEDAIFCSPEEKTVQACDEYYSPVCGIFNSSTVCKKSPCGTKFSNKCHACINNTVAYYVERDCESFN